MFLSKNPRFQRLIALVLTPIQLVVMLPVPLMALQPDRNARPVEMPAFLQPEAVERNTEASSDFVPPEPPSLPTVREIRENREPARTARIELPELDAENPSREALEARLRFRIPVRADSEAENPEENRAFLTAARSLESWRGFGRPSEAERFVDDFPASPWRAALQANLGDRYYREGYFTKALESWSDAWELSKDNENPAVRRMADRAGASLVGLLSRLGRMNELEILLDEFRGRPLYGVSANKVDEGWAALEVMKERPEFAFKCGPFALRSIREHQGQPRADLLRAVESTPRGFSLFEVQMMADELAMPMRMAFREPGAEVIVPSVVHW
jgi:hypothetical protein